MCRRAQGTRQLEVARDFGREKGRAITAITAISELNQSALAAKPRVIRIIPKYPADLRNHRYVGSIYGVTDVWGGQRLCTSFEIINKKTFRLENRILTSHSLYLWDQSMIFDV